ncbi:putative RING finger protein C32D5.10 [Toxocara canis]|uniref:RING-type E3 ubiquitin transferase n=1 Tax=Toxocara canis TaxID=6265 RepID=A0A0B2W3T9_TOXCA|nr:putative RING finger protein C32D5.10 [Toxocara canis]
MLLRWLLQIEYFEDRFKVVRLVAVWMCEALSELIGVWDPCISSDKMQRTKHEASSSGQSGNVPHTDRGRGIGSDERAGQMPGGSGAIKNGRCVVKVEESDVHEFSEKGVLSLHKSEDTDGSDPCPICLRRCEDEAKLDSCDHHFCFEHICEWISLNPVCPMCKRDVHKIMHNIRGVGADQLFDEVTVDELRNAAERKRIANESQRPMDSERRELLFMIRHLQRVLRDHDDMMARIERTSGGISPEWALRRQENVSRCSRYQLLLDSFDRPRAVVMADPAFRLLVYERHLLRRAIVDDFRAAGGARQRLNVSPTFFAEHDSEQRPRISAFVRREFAVLSQDVQHLDWFVDHVYETMCLHQINSPFFTTILCRESRVRRDYVDHFAQLLFEFAVSGQELEVFDENSEYIRSRFKIVAR